MEPMPTELELRAFVGKNADYYLNEWEPALAGERRPPGFNVAAFLLSGLWLGYRKMYKTVVIVFGIILVETVLEEVLFVSVLRMPEPPAGVGGVVGLVVAIVTGMYGNGWYLSHTKRVIAGVRAQGLDDDAYFRDLATRGGTSVAASAGLFVAFLVAVVAIFIVFDELFPQIVN